uniref:Uncharacterized protein n=1 Tax=Arundo donax TaxID=35708 RepID=A0A0A9FDL7_ARUDO
MITFCIWSITEPLSKLLSNAFYFSISLDIMPCIIQVQKWEINIFYRTHQEILGTPDLTHPNLFDNAVGGGGILQLIKMNLAKDYWSSMHFVKLKEEMERGPTSLRPFHWITPRGLVLCGVLMILSMKEHITIVADNIEIRDFGYAYSCMLGSTLSSPNGQRGDYIEIIYPVLFVAI